MSDILKLVAKRSERVDKYLSRELDLSRTYVEELILDEKVKVNGLIPKKKYKLNIGDTLEIEEYKPKEINILGSKMDLDIIYEDEDVLVINKDRGIVVHPAPGNYENTVVNGLIYLDKHLSLINGKFRPGIVHRIDKDTSGIIVVAKNDLAHNSLAKEFKNHSIERKYLALVVGELAESSGRIDLPISRDKSTRIKMAVNKDGKEAQTNYIVKKRYKGYTLVECSLETGRTHQIRVHFSYMNHPLVGDPLYGNKKDKYPLDGQYLHAYLLGFNHPRTKEYLEFKSEIPLYFENRIKEIKNS